MESRKGGGRLAPVAPTSCGSPVVAAADVVLGYRAGDDGLLQ